MSKQRYGCSSVVAAVNLQFELAGHGLDTNIIHDGKRWVCERAIHRVSPDTVTPFRRQWAQQAPQSLSTGTFPV